MANEHRQPEYITTIQNVKETALFGTADLDFWRARLKREDLFPFNVNGKAQITMNATQLKWNGMPFRELVISIAVCKRTDENTPDAAYLIHAYNSSRLLAFAERAFFQTPYYGGKIETSEHIPAFIAFDDSDGGILRAQMAGEHPRLRGEDEMLEGAIYLPTTGTQTGNVFFAKLGGYTEAYSFIPGTDKIEMKPSQQSPVFEWLVESQFAPQEWRLRNNATHARTKTYPKSYGELLAVVGIANETNALSTAMKVPVDEQYLK